MKSLHPFSIKMRISASMLITRGATTLRNPSIYHGVVIASVKNVYNNSMILVPNSIMYIKFKLIKRMVFQLSKLHQDYLKKLCFIISVS